MSEEISDLRRMRLIAKIEGSTLLLLLCVGVPLKHLAGLPAATTILGAVHGLAFILYWTSLVQTASSGSWSRSTALYMLLLALVPLGAFANERTLARRQRALETLPPPVRA